MNSLKRSFLLAHAISLLVIHCITNTTDSVVIITPALSSTVSGMPLSITGGASLAGARVRLKLGTTEIGSATTNGSGGWNFSVNNVPDGNYTLTAELISNSFDILAMDYLLFAVQSGELITITTPTENALIFLNPSTASGTSSEAGASVNLSIDGILTASTTTDADGNWTIPYTLYSNGIHTLLAELIVSGYTAATDTTDITAAIPIFLPASTSELRVIDGTIPTSGSGSGPGYTYSVSGSIVTINFIPAFSTLPSIVATGQRNSGSSTVTVSSLSTTAVSLTFNTGTQKIHFTASTLG